MPRKKKQIAINPREKLTRKAKEGIEKYVALKADKTSLRYQHFLIKWVLEAERMRREQLYAFLQERDYRWKYPYWLPQEDR